jgi:hypothetical protein
VVAAAYASDKSYFGMISQHYFTTHRRPTSAMALPPNKPKE